MAIDLMNEMVRRGHCVGLMTWDLQGAVPHYRLDPKVRWLKLNLGCSAAPSNFFQRLDRVRCFRSYIRDFQPSLIVGFQSGAALFSRVATLGLEIPIIAAERVSPDMWTHVRTGFFDRLTDIYSLILADRITVQFPEYKKKYPKILQKKIIPIHNPVMSRPIKPETNDGERKVLLYVARLCYQKNHTLLIDSFALLSHLYLDWDLVLVGDGEYEELLRQQVSRLCLETRIKFCGAVVDVDAWYERADLVAFPSHFEGFPNALAEALSAGIPCVGLKQTLGVNSLIQDSVNGLLVDSTIAAFANGLARLMSDSDKRKEMSNAARQISTMYAPSAAYELWEDLFQRMVID